jgi:hypothetical protein
LVKEFWRSFQPVQKELYEIRNELGAHRRLSDLASVQTLWRQLDVEKYVAVLNKFLPLFALLKELNIYDWSRSLEQRKEGAIALSIFGSVIIPPWEDAFEDEDI